jgi:hypothetical protein
MENLEGLSKQNSFLLKKVPCQDSDSTGILYYNVF